MSSYISTKASILAVCMIALPLLTPNAQERDYLVSYTLCQKRLYVHGENRVQMNPFWQRWMTTDASPELFVCCAHCATRIVRMSLDQYHLDTPLCSHVP